MKVYVPIWHGWPSMGEGTETGPAFTTRELAEAWLKQRAPSHWSDATIEEWEVFDRLDGTEAAA